MHNLEENGYLCRQLRTKITETMTMTTIANIALLTAALIGLFAMLRWDLTALQQNGYRNSRYNGWLKESSDLSSPKRIIVLAVLIGSFTTMAQDSWIVVMLLAVFLVALAISTLLKRHEKPLKCDGRVVSRFILAMALALIAIGGTTLMGQRMNEPDFTRPASMLAVMILAITPLLVMLVNWVIRPFEKSAKNDLENDVEPKDSQD